MKLLAGAAFAWCSVYGLLAIYFGILSHVRPRSRAPIGAAQGATLEARGGGDAKAYRLFGATCVLVAGYTFCNAMRFYSDDPLRAAQWGARAVSFAPLVPAFMMGVVVRYAELASRARCASLPRRWWLG